ncbi:MAG: hypothetical protein AB6733_24460 [Clostridiaceae bacterium]
MTNIDEKIAKLKLEERLEKERELNEKLQEEAKAKEAETKQKITVEEVMEQIKTGEVNIYGKSFKFVTEKFLNGLIEMPIPLAYFEEKVNTPVAITLVNDFYGISFTGSYVKKGAMKQTFAQFKAGMEQGFKSMEMYMEWLEEGEVGEGKSKVNYGTYKTPTGKGDVYNLIFRREYKGSLLIGNYNCFYKDIEIWELLIKASINLMKVN